MASTTYRSYQKGDELKIIDLFCQAIPQFRTTGFWNWINIENPFGNSIIEVTECDGKIIGHYGVMPLDLWIKGVPVKAGLAIQAVIHPAFRNFKNILRMTGRVWERCGQQGLEFVYAFPNENIWQINTAFMEWESIGDFRSWELPLGKNRKVVGMNSGDPIEVRRVASFTNRAHGIWDESPIRKCAKIALARTPDFLEWRFFEHPLQHYIVFIAENEGRDIGYIVLKLHRKEKCFYGHIVDVLTVEENAQSVFKALLEEAFKFFEWSKVDVVSCWMCPSNPYFEVLCSLGFGSKGFNTHFGYRRISGNIAEEIRRLENWYLTMADSDAF